MSQTATKLSAMGLTVTQNRNNLGEITFFKSVFLIYSKIKCLFLFFKGFIGYAHTIIWHNFAYLNQTDLILFLQGNKFIERNSRMPNSIQFHAKFVKKSKVKCKKRRRRLTHSRVCQFLSLKCTLSMRVEIYLLVDITISQTQETPQEITLRHEICSLSSVIV